MNREVLLTIRSLLTTQRVASLAVLVDGEPEASLLPYALRPDYGAIYVQASALARHTRGLRSGAVVGVLVHAPDAPDEDPLQIPRLSVRAVVGVLARDSEQFAAGSALFVGRFPGAAVTLDLADFNLYELALGRGRYVEGFARAFNVGADTFEQLAVL
jgi:putative heme iron utilization protein